MRNRFAAILAVAAALGAWAASGRAEAEQQQYAVGAGAPVFSQFLMGETIADAPLSARVTTLTVQELYDGNRLVNESVVMLFRDSAGRIRRESTIPGHALSQSTMSRNTITISDPVAGQVLTLDPANRRAFRLAGASPFASSITIRMDDETPDSSADGGSQTPAIAAGDSSITFSGVPAESPEDVALSTSTVGSKALPTTFFVGRFNQPSTLFAAGAESGAGPDVVLESLGEAEINGVPASGQRQTTTYPIGLLGNELPVVVTKETWYAPGLGMVVRSEERDPRFGTISYSVEVLSTEEPDSTLFELPADYRVTSPVIESPVRID